MRKCIHYDEFVDDAAKQFDELTDGSDLSLNKAPAMAKGSSCQGLNQLAKSSSSSKSAAGGSSEMAAHSQPFWIGGEWSGVKYTRTVE